MDIDETISITDYASLMSGLGGDRSRPYRHARETLTALSEGFELVYLTSRPQWLSGETRHWLNKKEFPRGNVLTTARMIDVYRPGSFKKRALGTMRHAWPTADRIGDRPTDCEAYVANGMLALVVNPRRGVAYNPIAIFLKDWHAIEAFFQVTRKSARSGGPRRGIQGGAAAARPRHRAHRAEVDVYVFFRASFL